MWCKASHVGGEKSNRPSLLVIQGHLIQTGGFDRNREQLHVLTHIKGPWEWQEPLVLFTMRSSRYSQLEDQSEVKHSKQWLLHYEWKGRDQTPNPESQLCKNQKENIYLTAVKGFLLATTFVSLGFLNTFKVKPFLFIYFFEDMIRLKPHPSQTFQAGRRKVYCKEESLIYDHVSLPEVGECAQT